MGRLVVEILAVAETQPQIGDTEAIKALRGCTRRIPPNDPAARTLYDRLQQVAASDRVAPREFRRALDQLLQIAQQQSSDSGNRDAFLGYLAVLAAD